MSGGTTLSIVLERLVRGAVELTHARHGVLAVLDPPGNHISDHVMADAAMVGSDGGTVADGDPPLSVLSVPVRIRGRTARRGRWCSSRPGPDR